MKRIIGGLIMVMLISLLSGCGLKKANADNALTGKDTDQRIIMCLQNAYPDHEFKVVKSFEKQKNEGIFEDENGLEFKVRDLIYNNTYHFGCRDEYLSTILKNEDFFEKAKKVVEEKYGQKLVYNKNTMSIDIIYDDNNQITTDEISQLVQEVLNIVDTPKVKYPADREFSTNVVNYYTLPALGVLQCYIEEMKLEKPSYSIFLINQ